MITVQDRIFSLLTNFQPIQTDIGLTHRYVFLHILSASNHLVETKYTPHVFNVIIKSNIQH